MYKFERIDIFNRLNDYYLCYKGLFPDSPLDLSWFRWYYKLFKVRTYVILDNNKIIGTWNVESRKFQYHGKIINVGRCFSVGISEKYRRQGLFVELSKYAIEQERITGEYEYILGFPNVKNPVLQGHLKSGWYPVLDIHKYELKRHDIIFQNKKIDFVAKNVEFSRYGEFYTTEERFKSNPNYKYIVIDDLVLKPYQNFCHILQLEDANQLFIAKKLCVNHQWDRLTIWYNDNDIFRHSILQDGFIPSGKVRKLIALNMNAKYDIELPNCHFNHGIEEAY